MSKHQMPPTFNHLDNSEEERAEAFRFWSRRFEAFAEGYCGHKRPPAASDEDGNKEWKRLLELALEAPTARLVDSHYPDLRVHEVTYMEIIEFLKDRFVNQSSEYQSLNAMLEAFQKPGEPFSDFLDRVRGMAARSGFATLESRDFMIRHQALRGTTSQTIRTNALQHKWSLRELQARAREIETSMTAAACNGQKGRATFQVEAPNLDEEIDGPVSVQRVGGPYSKQARLKNGFQGHQYKGKACGYCGKLLKMFEIWAFWCCL